MTIRPMIAALVGLAACAARAWPQVSPADHLSLSAPPGSSSSISDSISYAPPALRLRGLAVDDGGEVYEEDAFPRVLPVPVNHRRGGRGVGLPIPADRRRGGIEVGLPVEDEIDLHLATLPAPHAVPRAYQSARADAGFLTLPVVRGQGRRGRLDSRDVEIPLANRSDVAYYAQLEIGTPPQRVYVNLDTGSYELWVSPNCSGLGRSSDAHFCKAAGSYRISRSSTGAPVPSADIKSLSYGIGSALITYAVDDMAVGSASLSRVQFGVASSSENQFTGILGIGFGQGRNTKYPNFIDALAAQGVTRTRAFGLGLGAKDDADGSVVFGGADTAKFAGPLAALAIVPAADSPDGTARYWVQMQSVALTPPSGQTRFYDNSSLPVFLDSGATLTLLPAGLVRSIAADFGADTAAGLSPQGDYTVDCGLGSMSGTIDFQFNGMRIKVPYREMIRQSRSDPPVCCLGIAPSDEFSLLGDTFLRSAYIVVDQDSSLVYMAPYTSCGTQTVPINTPADIASLSGICAQDPTRGGVTPASSRNITAAASSPLPLGGTASISSSSSSSSRVRSPPTMLGGGTSWWRAPRIPALLLAALAWSVFMDGAIQLI